MTTTRHALAVPLLAIALGTAAVPPRASAAPADDAAAVKKLEEESVKADLSGDASAFVTRHFADDMSSGTSFGEWETKQAMLKDLADKPNNKVNAEEISDLKVRVYGSTAIATYRSTYDMMVRGEHRARAIIATDTWVKQKDGWKLVASHASEVKK